MSEAALVLEVDATGETALVELRGARRRLSVALLTLEGMPVAPGDWVLASAGMAVAPLDADDAQELRELVSRAHKEDRS
jgi:hydrogenase maturation factor